jgi:hypothetical protein
MYSVVNLSIAISECIHSLDDGMAVPKHVVTKVYEVLLCTNRHNVALKYLVLITVGLIDMISHVNFRSKCTSNDVPLKIVSGQKHEITFMKSVDVIFDGCILIN